MRPGPSENDKSSNFERGLQFIHRIRRFHWLKMRQNRQFYMGFTLKSCARACRPAGKRRQGNFSGRCSSGPKITSEWLKTTVLRPFPAALQGSASRVIFPGGAVAVRKLHQNYNGFVRLKASKCERYVLSAIQTPTEGLRAQKDPQNASLCACVPQPLCPKPLDSGLWFGLGGCCGVQRWSAARSSSHLQWVWLWLWGAKVEGCM